MNMAVRRLFLRTPILRRLYPMARKVYNRHRILKAAKGYFIDFADYRSAFDAAGGGKLLDIRTKDGLTFTIRPNYADAAVLAETFLDNSYVRGLTLSDQPVVVDIGGYIGDFALYAATRLHARKVVVCEPSPRNWALLMQNVVNNHYEDRIAMVNKAVTDGEDVVMNIDAPDRDQALVSAYGHSNEKGTSVAGITLSRLVAEHGLKVIDLLKMDCEGGEYTILATMPDEVFSRTRNIVFEYHEIDGFEAKLKAAKQKLCDEGFSLHTHGSLVSASRA